MPIITRYPSTEINLCDDHNEFGQLTEAEWINLDKIEANDGVFASCPVTASTGVKNKPGKIIASNFGFNINKNSRINSIEAEWIAYIRAASDGTTNVPVIPGITIRIVSGKVVIGD